MKQFKDFLVRLNILGNFFNSSIIKWMIISIISSFMLGIIEINIAILIQFFLASLGMIQLKEMFFGIKVENISTNIFLILLLSIGFIRFVFSVLNQHGANYVLEVSNLRFKSLSIMNLISFGKRNLASSSEIHFQISELAPKFSYFISCFMNFTSYSIQCLILLFFMFKLSFTCLFFSLIGMLMVGLIVIYINKKVKLVSKKIPSEMYKLNSGIERVSRNIFFINVMKKNKVEENELLNSAMNYSSLTIKSSFLNIFVTTLTSFLGIFLLIVIIYTATILFPIPGVVLLSFIYLFIRFVQNISSVLGALGQMNTYFEQFKLSLDFFDNINIKDFNKSKTEVNFFGFFKNQNNINLKSESSQLSLNKRNTDTQLSQSSMISPKIEIIDMHYFYSRDAKEIFSKFNLTVHSGKQCAIIGSSGSGKSTLLSLILGLYKPSIGKILLNGIEPKEFFENSQNRVGYVGSEPFLIKGSILDNLLYGVMVSATQEDIDNAIRLAKIDNFINDVGLNYFINEDHSGLSTGQKQRLCLARAILNKPCILILDEVSANLDLETELEISESLKSLNKYCTILLVSHREGIMRYADEIVKL
ncbi:ABC transporter ATP-binding protein [Silvanigrella paludirubra]|nr:ABC transporter ATP-binding protein [Silvanigrella paludirubra]